MTRIVKSACPECGASIRFDADGLDVTCDYCGAVARIERAKPPKNGPPPASGPVVYAPRALTRAVVAGVIATAVLPVVIGLVVTALQMSPQAQIAIPSAKPGAGQGLFEHMQWQGNRRAMLADLNGDGALDPIGWVRFLSGTTSNDHIAAFDAQSGKRLWLTPPISDISQSYQTRAVIAADKLLVADPAGMLRAFGLANGQQVWSAVLGERVERICGAEAGNVRVETTDKRALSASLTSGQLTPTGEADPKSPCGGVQSSDGKLGLFSGLFGGTWKEGGIVNPEIEGMDVEHVLVDFAAGTHVALGTKEPGTRVPMAALYDARGVTEKKPRTAPRWLSAIPSANPLAVREGAPDTAAIAQGRLLVVFPMQSSSDGARLACLDLATGRGLWEVPIPSSDKGSLGPIAASDRQVFVSHWTWLEIFDLATGAHRTTVGVW